MVRGRGMKKGRRINVAYRQDCSREIGGKAKLSNRCYTNYNLEARNIYPL